MSKYTSVVISIRSIALVGFAVAALFLTIPFSAAHADTYPQRVSVASDGTQANGDSYIKESISADDRYVAFDSAASNLVPSDTNGALDIFVHDTVTGTTTRVSVAPDGSQGNGQSARPSISADGRYVAFDSAASNLVPSDTNGALDIFVHDTVTGTTTRVSVAPDGSQGNGQSAQPSISADGQYVAFISAASNLIPGDTNATSDAFVHDMKTGATTRVSVASDGTQGNAGSLDNASISADGRYIAFSSAASNLVPSDTNSARDIFVRDTVTGTTTRVSVATDGTEGNSLSYSFASISADGRYIAFYSIASNLVPGDTNGVGDIFVHDTVTGTTTRVSVASDGTQGSSGLFPSISADGRYVAFESDAPNLVPGDTNATSDIFVHDTLTGATARVSVAADGTQGNNYSGAAITSQPPISPDGRYVAFGSAASNLVPGDTNGTWDVFLTQNQLSPGFTTTGTNVSVAPDTTDASGNPITSSPLTLTFASTTGSGFTSVQESSTGATPPSGFKIGNPPTYYSISTTATFTGSVQVCINYSGVSYGNESTLKLSHYDSTSGVWTDITTSIDTTNNIICGLTTSFSDFAIFEPSNEAPVLSPIGNKSVAEGQTLSFTLSATDADGDALTYSASNLPAGATFSTTTHTFSWTPTYDQAGNYTNVEFTVTDNGSPMMLDFEDIIITVGNVNRAPIFTSPATSSQQVLENNALSFTVSATDPDNDSVTLSASNLPAGATFNTGTGAFSWTPTTTQSGIYTVNFAATDNGSPATTTPLQVVITVGDNPTPPEQAENLINVVVAGITSTSIENSYLANLNKVATFIENGQVQSAINQLNAFIQKVEQDYSHGYITQAQRDNFVSLAQDLINALN